MSLSLLLRCFSSLSSPRPVSASLVVVKGSVSGTAAGGNLRDWGVLVDACRAGYGVFVDVIA